MDKSKFIKVTVTGYNPTVVLASQKAIYQKQGATIAEPTEEEILLFFPNLKEEIQPDAEISKDEHDKIVSELNETNEEKDSKIEELEESNAKLATDLGEKDSKIKELETEITRLSAEIEDATKQIQKLQKK